MQGSIKRSNSCEICIDWKVKLIDYKKYFWILLQSITMSLYISEMCHNVFKYVYVFFILNSYFETMFELYCAINIVLNLMIVFFVVKTAKHKYSLHTMGTYTLLSKRSCSLN